MSRACLAPAADFVVHLTTATADEIDAVAKARVPAVVCPRIQGVMGLGVPRFDWMLERGMLVALGTDNLMLCGPDLLRELEYSSRVVRAIRTSATYPSARQLLQMVTVNPRILGVTARSAGARQAGRCRCPDAGSLNLRPVRDPVATIVNRADSRTSPRSCARGGGALSPATSRAMCDGSARGGHGRCVWRQPTADIGDRPAMSCGGRIPRA
jgi:cytosine/adenosine deaminase-related metal-dependent hydrolase